MIEVPVRDMNVMDHTVTWKKKAVISTLEPVDVIIPTEPGATPVGDLTLKTDLLEAVDEEIKTDEKNTSSIFQTSMSMCSVKGSMIPIPGMRETLSRLSNLLRDILCHNYKRFGSRRQISCDKN